MSKTINKRKIDWVPFLFLTLSPIGAILLTATYFYITSEPNYWFFLVAVIFYSITAVSITGGYHRLFSHKAYYAPFITRMFYALFGAASFQNSILKWATEHRIHHRFVDTEQDPYNINEGFFHAHIGWMLWKTPESKHFKIYSRDLKKDKVVMWQHKHYVPIAITMGVILPGVIGYFMGSVLGGIAIPGLLRIVALHHGTFFINSLCHIWGKQTFTKENSARDNFVLAVLTFGEGYHNYHHKFATDYRNGIKWYHWDPTKWAIQAKSFLGLASNLKTYTDEEILKATLDFETDFLLSKFSHHQEIIQTKVEELKSKFQEAHENFCALKKEYANLIQEKKAENKLKIKKLKLEIANAKNEISMQWLQWQMLQKEALTQV